MKNLVVPLSSYEITETISDWSVRSRASHLPDVFSHI